MKPKQAIENNKRWKLCPFCKAEPLDFADAMNIVYCEKCGAKASPKVWNNRPIEDELETKVKELSEKSASL